MLKKLLFFCFLIFLFNGKILAQAIPNNGFESWNLTPVFEHPVAAPAPLFQSSNTESFYRFGILTATKVAGVTGHALRIENKAAPNGDTIKAIAAWGNVNSGAMNKGIPLSAAQPLTGLAFDIKYNVNPVTPGFVAIIPTTAGNPSGAGNGIFPGAYVYPISGMQTSFMHVDFSFLPALTINPDSCIVVFSTSDMINTEKGTIGDYLEVDNLQWLGTSDVFPNGNLEIWENIPPLEVPEFWTVRTENPSEFTFAKSTDAHDGNFSLQLINRVWSQNDKMVGTASLGYYRCPNDNGPCDAIPGMELTNSPHSLGFYYKYSTPGVDTAQAWTSIYTEGVGYTSSAYTQMLPTNEWKFASMMLNNPSAIADSAFISIESGKWNTAVNGSTLLIDDIKFHFCDELATIEGPVTLCTNATGVSYAVSSEFGFNYAWSTTSGTINGSDNDSIVTIDNITSDATISVVKTYNDGCPDKVFNLNVVMTANATSVGGVNQNLCENDTIVFLDGEVTGATGGTWTTSGAGSFDDMNDLQGVYHVDPTDISAGTITFTLTPTGTAGCVVTAGSSTVTVVSAPTVEAGLNQTVCFGDAISLTASGTASNYTWSHGVMDGISFVPTGGLTTYTLTGTDANNCASFDVVNSTVNYPSSVALNVSSYDTVCVTNVAFALSGGLPSGGTYSGMGVSSGMFDPSVAGVGSHSISYTFVDANLCSNTDVKQVVVESVCSPTALAEVHKDKFKVYLNPSSEMFYFKMDSKQDYKIEIYDLTGKLIYQSNFKGSDCAVDLSSKEAGVYFAKITSSNSSYYKKLILK